MSTRFDEARAVMAAVAGDTMRAVGFLSRFPVPPRFFEGTPKPLGALAPVFPLAGIVIALPGAAALAACAASDAPPMVAGFLVVAIEVAVTGGLHEDGLADTADGLGAGRDRERALSIMRDSRVGVFGAIALVLALGLRAAALGALITATPNYAASPLAAGFAVLGLAAASRAAMVWHWQALAPARPDGVAAEAGAPDRLAALRALALGGLVFAVCLIPGVGLAPALASLAAVVALTTIFVSHCDAAIGGHTGDTLGAAQQLATIAGLVALVLTL